MRKIVIFLFVLIAVVLFPITSFAAEPVPKILEEAKVFITSDGENKYVIKQEISLKGNGDFNGDQIEHTFSNINNVTPENLQFMVDGVKLEYTKEEANTLTRYFVTIPHGYVDNFNYEINYTLTVKEGEFTTPLFVPMHPSEGQKNVVTIDFKTTAENIVFRNSFPVLKKSEDNEVTSYLMNIPSHVNYIFGTEKNIFNSHNIYSWASIIVLLTIIFIWIRSELKTNKQSVNAKGDKGVVN